jgi:hypothetical protein
MKIDGDPPFPPQTIVNIKAYTLSPLNSRGSTAGQFSIYLPNQTEEVEDTLIFANSDSESLSYPCYSVKELKWLGKGLGEVTVSDRTAKVSQPGYGVLRVRYLTVFHRLRLSNVREEIPVLCWCTDTGGRSGYVQIDFSESEEDERDVYIVVKDFCSDLPVPNAYVIAKGKLYGPTRADGRVYIGKYQKGERIDLKITAPGYTDSDVDALANDYFEVR